MTPADIDMGETENGGESDDDDALQPSLPMSPGEDQQQRF